MEMTDEKRKRLRQEKEARYLKAIDSYLGPLTKEWKAPQMGMVQVPRKDGTIGDNTPWVSVPPLMWSPLNQCSMCKKLGEKRQVRSRPDAAYWWWPAFKTDKEWREYSREEWLKYGDSCPWSSVLCTGCWNKARAIVRRKAECHQTIKLIKKAQREIANVRKNQNHG